MERENKSLKSNDNSKDKKSNLSDIKKLESKIKDLTKQLDKEKSKKVNRDRTEKEKQLDGQFLT